MQLPREDESPAAVRPLDVDGVLTVSVGTAAWFLASLGLLPFVPTLRDSGHLWWLWTCCCGTALGVLGLAYCRRRRRSLRRAGADTVGSSQFGAAG